MEDDESDLSQKPAAIWRSYLEQSRINALLVDNTSGGVGSGEHNLVNVDTSEAQVLSYNEVKQRLITHFNIANAKREVYWPTKAGIISNYVVATDR
jgi:hypothetical protein